jgi:hypothetical protein
MSNDECEIRGDDNFYSHTCLYTAALDELRRA